MFSTYGGALIAGSSGRRTGLPKKLVAPPGPPRPARSAGVMPWGWAEVPLTGRCPLVFELSGRSRFFRFGMFGRAVATRFRQRGFGAAPQKNSLLSAGGTAECDRDGRSRKQKHLAQKRSSHPRGEGWFLFQGPQNCYILLAGPSRRARLFFPAFFVRPAARCLAPC